VKAVQTDLGSLVRFKRLDVSFFAVTFTFSVLLFCFLSYHFFSNDFFHLKTISYAEKARLAVEGLPPRLENVGFVYPPLPVFISILFPLPWLAQGVVSGTVFTLLTYLAVKFYRDSFPAFLMLALYLPFLFAATFKFDTLLLFFLIASSTLLLLKYWEEGFSLYLFAGGLLFGLSFFIDFSALYLIFVYAGTLFLKKKEKLSHRLGVIMVFLLPLVFFFLFTLFINYTFKGDAFHFLKGYSLLFPKSPQVLQAQYSLYTALALLFDYLKKSFLLVLPYFVGFFLVKRWREFYASPIFLIYVSPLLLLFLKIRYGTFSFSLTNSLLFIFFLLLFMNRFRFKLPIYLFLLLSIVSAPFLYLKSMDGNEVNFALGLMGKPFERNLLFYREIAREINRLKGKVLLDDKSFYPTVYFVSNLRKLLLPYQYDFYTVLASPCGKVDFVVGMVGGKRDEVYLFYPEIEELKLDKCEFYGRVGNAVFFNCRKCYGSSSAPSVWAGQN